MYESEEHYEGEAGARDGTYYGRGEYEPPIHDKGGQMYSMDSGGDSQTYSYNVPEEIRRFIHFFHQHVTEQNLYDIQLIYETSFNKLTERYFEKSPWPDADYVANLVDGDQVFLILYKELYYRHIYNKLKPTLEHRFESYFNYCDLFNYILNTDEPVPLSLPNQWLWDIIDEFIYQVPGGGLWLGCHGDLLTAEEIAALLCCYLYGTYPPTKVSRFSVVRS